MSLLTTIVTWITVAFASVLGVRLLGVAFNIKSNRRSRRDSGKDGIYSGRSNSEPTPDPVIPMTAPARHDGEVELIIFGPDGVDPDEAQSSAETK